MDDKTKELARADPKRALRWVYAHVKPLQGIKCFSQVCQVGVEGPALDHHIVHVYLYVSPDMVLKYFIKHSLVCSPRILLVGKPMTSTSGRRV